MRRYTTPTIEVTVKGADLTAYDLYVTFAQGGRTITVEGPEAALVGEDTVIEVPLTQEQTAALRVGRAVVQVNWLNEQGHRDATVTREVEVTANLLEEVLP